ncbi:hypothetical protein RB195_016872 [Necator americanus]|uniref:Uncharacterized protein n=1 Tax=Necator americanus TaxID=51031 RepID=A0ABR1C429_NECAM
MLEAVSSGITHLKPAPSQIRLGYAFNPEWTSSAGPSVNGWADLKRKGSPRFCYPSTVNRHSERIRINYRDEVEKEHIKVEFQFGNVIKDKRKKKETKTSFDELLIESDEEEPFVDGEATVQNSIVPVESDLSEDDDGYDESDDNEEKT